MRKTERGRGRGGAEREGGEKEEEEEGEQEETGPQFLSKFQSLPTDTNTYAFGMI